MSGVEVAIRFCWVEPESLGRVWSILTDLLYNRSKNSPFCLCICLDCIYLTEPPHSLLPLAREDDEVSKQQAVFPRYRRLWFGFPLLLFRYVQTLCDLSVFAHPHHKTQLCSSLILRPAFIHYCIINASSQSSALKAWSSETLRIHLFVAFIAPR